MLNRTPVRAGAALLLTACAAFAQAPASGPVFEVATIKPAAPITPQKVAAGQLHVGMKIDAGRVDIGFMSLTDLMNLAYKVKQYQISGPDWMNGQRYDIVAKMPDGATKEQVPDMLKALLEERFKLVIHHESKEHSVYALVVGKNGPKLKESPPDAPAPPADAPVADAKNPGTGFTVNTGNGAMRVTPGDGGKSMVVTGGENGKMTMTMGADGTMHMQAERLTMEKFAEALSRFAGRPVVDMTELKGNFQVGLDLSMQDLQNVARAAGMGIPNMAPGGNAGGAAPADAASDPSGTTIFNSVQQLGLKLDPRKEQIDVIVVDRAEKTPTEN